MDYKKLADDALIRLIGMGKVDALGELYDRYSRLVFSIALNSIGDRETAEEITQDVFTRVWERSKTYDISLAKVSTWLISITRNRSIDEFRRSKARPEPESLEWAETDPDLSEKGDSPEEQVDLIWQQNSVRRAIALLPEDQQRVLALAYFQGYSHSEIADLINEPLGTVKTRIRLAMQKLRQLLSKELVGDE